MAYFLGRNITVDIAAEDSSHGVEVDATTGEVSIYTVGGEGSGYAGANFATSLDWLGDGDYSDFPKGRVANCLGIDLSIGSMDEDVTFMGKRTVQKMEMKKETNITLTRKKQDMSWDAIFNSGYRWGISGTSRNEGLSKPDIYHGYRLVLNMVSGDSPEVMTVRNACIAGHGESLSADGTIDETMEFYSYVEPVISGSVDSGATPSIDM